MALESVVFPIPSELVMPLAGYQLIENRGRGPEWLLLAGFYGAIGTTLGAWFAYWLGMVGGRPVVEKWGKYLLISKKDLDISDRFFQKWGNWAVFFGRLIPLVRSFISVPAGIARMPFWQFTVYSFMGAYIWSIFLAYAGYRLGREYEDVRGWIDPIQYPVAGILALLVLAYIYRQVKEIVDQHREEKAEAMAAAQMAPPPPEQE
jgi:membrane protein DedA with SNARE-associated domain